MSEKQEFIDLEWFELLLEAKQNGLTVEEIQHFLKEDKEEDT
ncbi:DNA-binding anti-repressor SinI [Halalkalibacter sp. APA_J-10(15)]|nr:DNA-binding anti-repressor SinI [Halalkalibacter sp. APA_J-10(15)]MCK0470363.1 anti-repressor SinI family protein [Halalkalibacter sp. APA_J-10(15)]